MEPSSQSHAPIGVSGKQTATAASARMLSDAGVPASSAPAVAPALLPRSASESSPPAWVELIPAGIFHGRDGRGPFRLAEPAAVIAATEALKMQAGIPIDYDHATDFAAPEGRPAPAAGWIRELAARDGAIWGRVDWTPRAAAAIRAREYRYISPVFQFDPAEGTVTRLLRAGLTNNPNLCLTAIATAAHLTAAANKDGIMDDFLDQLREALGLDDDASPEDIVDCVRALLAARDGDGNGDDTAASAASPDPARLVAVAEFQKALTELNAMRAERATEKAERLVDDAIRAGKLIPAQRAWATAYCAADAAGFRAFMARQPAVIAAGTELDGEPPRREGRAGILSQAETAICAQLGLKHSDFSQTQARRRRFPPPRARWLSELTITTTSLDARGAVRARVKEHS
jgi:phage I-like protein